MLTPRDILASGSLLPVPAEARSPGGAGGRSRLRAGASRLLLGAALLSATRCDGPVFNELFTTEHFVYHVEEGATPPCDGTAQWLERYYEANTKFLGATLPAGVKMHYYLVGNRESLPCPSYADACVHGTTIYAFMPVHTHEIAHANAFLLGDPPALFKEGLATALSCANLTDTEGPLDTSEPIEELMENEAFRGFVEANGFGVYVASMSFVKFLIDERGAARFLSFYARARRDGSRQEIGAVFQAELGVGLDDALSGWRAKPPSYISDLCVRLMDCDPSISPLTDTDVTFGCGHLGFSSIQESVFRFDVPNDRLFHVTMDPVPTEPYFSSVVSFYRCTGGSAIGQSVRTAGIRAGADRKFHLDPMRPGSAVALDVPPGEYVAWFQRPGPEEARVHVDVEERRSPMRNTACEPAEEPLALDDKHPTTLATRWIERPCDGPWCPGQSWDVSIGATGGALEARTLDVNGTANFSPGELYICSAPCPEDTSQCEILALNPRGQPVQSTQTFEPGTVLYLGAPAAPFADRFAVELRVASE